MDNSKDFKEGLKATSLFGGVQVFQIFISVLKSKLVALLLGPEGMGIQGILDSTIRMINGFTGLGLGTSAVKDISEAFATGNSSRVGRTLTVLRKLVWLTGLLGFLACFLLSPVLSKISFGSYDYVIAFAAVSVTLLFMQLSSGQSALLQGTRHFRYMAKAKVLGSVLGLFTAVPLFYFFRFEGIVPAIILTYLTTLLLSWYFSRKVAYEKVQMTYGTAIKEGKGMVQMGFFISLQALLALLSGYIIRIFINRVGCIADVGLFTAGFTIVNTYLGLVFSSMGTEYYPRLASKNQLSIREFNNTINQQIEISIILISPLICSFLVFGNFAVSLLYSNKFEPVTMMLCFAIFGNLFKAPSWCIAFSFLAKADSKPFLYNEILSIIVNATLQISFYSLWGLTGIGVAYLINYILYLVQVYIICHYRYGYIASTKLLRVFLPQFLLGFICFILFVYAPSIIRFTIGCILMALSTYISYKCLNRHFDVKSAFLSLLKNQKK